MSPTLRTSSLIVSHWYVSISRCRLFVTHKHNFITKKKREDRLNLICFRLKNTNIECTVPNRASHSNRQRGTTNTDCATLHATGETRGRGLEGGGIQLRLTLRVHPRYGRARVYTSDVCITIHTTPLWRLKSKWYTLKENNSTLCIFLMDFIQYMKSRFCICTITFSALSALNRMYLFLSWCCI